MSRAQHARIVLQYLKNASAPQITARLIAARQERAAALESTLTLMRCGIDVLTPATETQELTA